ncbi:hypothetical protein SLS57_007328 [Botryosphaeria dothidea]
MKPLDVASASAACAPPSIPLSATNDGSESGKLSISFLLSFTNPHNDTCSEVLVAQNLSESLTNQPATSYAAQPDYFSTEDHGSLSGAHSISYSELLSSLFLEIWDEGGAKDANQWHPQSGTEPDVSYLACRAKEIVRELSSLYKKLRPSDATTVPFFDATLAERVITGSNLRNFIRASFTHFFRNIAVIHLPTFDPETVALPLLLAAFMVGSVFTVPTDDALSVRQFLDIAEDYIFRVPEFQALVQDGPHGTVKRYDELLEYVQAALLICSTQMSMNDRKTRRRIKTQRNPSLIAAVRALLSKSRNEPIAPLSPDSEWQRFIATELRARILYMTFINDALLTIHFNNPPSIIVSELTDPLPCPDALFEAETPEAFNQLRTAMFATRSLRKLPLSLASLVTLFMQESWAPSDEAKLEGITVRHMLAAIAGSSDPPTNLPLEYLAQATP